VAADELACKPGSVGRTGVRPDGHPSTIAVADDLLRSTRKLGRAALERFLSDLAPGGVCQAARVTPNAGGLLPHRFTLTRRPRSPGGLFSVALSRGSPRVGVADHPALRSPDFPRRRLRGDADATVRPTRPPTPEYGRKRFRGNAGAHMDTQTFAATAGTSARQVEEPSGMRELCVEVNIQATRIGLRRRRTGK
jgi:hypothetical protein